jgi:hypothetical protein
LWNKGFGPLQRTMADARERWWIINVVGPAGLPLSKECKHLARAETVGNPDISRCLSQPSVSLGASKSAPKPRTNLSAERLREVLSYDPLTGEFRWLMASNPRVHVGKIAGCANSHGHWLIGIDGTQYYAHRLAFLYMTGKFPDLDVDHADGDRSNNRWANLREATDSLNQANARRPSHNTSGFKGVHWDRQKQKWRTAVRMQGRDIKLGFFDKPEEAHAAYLAAATRHFGEFANGGVRHASS